MVWYGVKLYGMVWYDMVWYGVVWCGVVWYDMVWCGMLWFGIMWYSMVKKVFTLLNIFQFPCFECDGDMPDVLKKAMAALEQVRVLIVLQYK